MTNCMADVFHALKFHTMIHARYHSKLKNAYINFCRMLFTHSSIDHKIKQN